MGCVELMLLLAGNRVLLYGEIIALFFLSSIQNT